MPASHEGRGHGDKEEYTTSIAFYTSGKYPGRGMAALAAAEEGRASSEPRPWSAQGQYRRCTRAAVVSLARFRFAGRVAA